jgi:uncharacterized protein
MTELDQPTPEGTDSHYKATGSAVVRETHSAYVFLLDTVAYKKKKSVRTDFLDFSSVDSRWSALDREYTLNCRFAPEVYMGIAELTDPAGGPAEPLLKMRRLPDSAKLSTLAAAGTDLTDYLSDIARIVASVHLHSPRNETISHEGTREALRGRWHANLHELRALSPGIIDDTVLDAIEVRSARYIDGRGALFDARIATGHVVDGHGDLLADDIFCMPDGPRILDRTQHTPSSTPTSRPRAMLHLRHSWITTSRTERRCEPKSHASVHCRVAPSRKPTHRTTPSWP